jgi:serine/threonine-protein kinase
VARDIALGRRIVVKVLPREMAAMVHVERFRREIQLAASLLHPHLVPVLHAGEAGGLPYYTMPFVEGESLRGRLLREGRLAVQEAVELARQVATALDYAHRQGVIHRDIKPDNILLHDGNAMVTDFGIARALGEAATQGALTTLGIALGTPAYMSPEQIDGSGEIDARADVYALGCVLYEVIAGVPAYPGASPDVILMQHLHQPVPDVRTRRPEVSAAVRGVITTAMAKTPEHRFASAATMASALEASRAARAQEVDTRRFIAVLPFDNLSADPENDYSSDDMTEDIIACTMAAISRGSTLTTMRRPRARSRATNTRLIPPPVSSRSRA